MNVQISLDDLEQESNGVDRYVRRVAYDEVKPFLLGIHYARRMPNITDAFGLFLGGALIGVVTFGVPASRPLCIGIAGVENEKNVLELNRLCLLPEHNGNNNASFLISRALKQLPNKTFVVSYADTAWTHIGYIYQACNFLYTGLSAKRNDTYQPNGLHPRAYDKNNHSDLMQSRSQKHRYIYLVGNKSTRRIMLRELRYPIIKEYPKGTEKRYNVDDPQIVTPIQVIRRKDDLREVGRYSESPESAERSV